MPPRKFDELDKEEQREVLWIFLFLLAVAAATIAAIICCFKSDWSSAVGFGLCAVALWGLMKFLFSDNWNI